MILESLIQSTPSTHRDFEAAFGTKKDANGYYVFRMRLPRVLLGGIGDPKRIVFTGTPHEGFTITGTKDKHEGLVVNYEQASARSLVFTMGFKQMKLTKMPRRMTGTTGRVVDGAIKIGGMPEDWINAKSPFLDDGKTAGPTHARLAASPISGAIPQPNGEGYHVNGIDYRAPEPAHVIGATSPIPKPDQRIPDTVTVEEIKTRLELALREAGRLRTALERKTHLNFKITQDLRLVVDLGGESSSPSKS